MLFETEVVACICHSPLHHQKPDFEGQSVIKTSSYLLPFVLEAHRESLPRSCETSACRLSAESAEVYSTADLPASAAHTFPSHTALVQAFINSQAHLLLLKSTSYLLKSVTWTTNVSPLLSTTGYCSKAVEISVQ